MEPGDGQKMLIEYSNQAERAGQPAAVRDTERRDSIRDSILGRF